MNHNSTQCFRQLTGRLHLNRRVIGGEMQLTLLRAVSVW